MDDTTSMTNESHDGVLRDSDFVAPGNIGDAKAVKCEVGQPDPAKEVMPIDGGGARHIEAPLAALGDHPSEQRDELRRERELRKAELMALSAESYNTLPNINLLPKIDVGLAEAASLIPGDKVTDAHPFRSLEEACSDKAMLALSDAWLSFRQVSTDPEALAWVAGGESAVDGLAHEQAEKLDLEQRGVFRALVSGIVRTGSPANIIPDGLPGKLAGNVDAPLAQESGEIAPGAAVTLSAAEAAVVTLLEEAWDPSFPCFRQTVRALFFARKFTRQFPRLTAFCDRIETEVRRALKAPPAPIEVADPVEGTSVAPIQASHATSVERDIIPNKLKQSKS